MYTKLGELGHPRYSYKECIGNELMCSIDHQAANERVKETEAELMGWITSVTELRSKHSWLLFFSVPKLLKLHSLLTGEISEDDLDKIVCEISFLCVNKVSAVTDIKAGVKVSWNCEIIDCCAYIV